MILIRNPIHLFSKWNENALRGDKTSALLAAYHLPRSKLNTLLARWAEQKLGHRPVPYLQAVSSPAGLNGSAGFRMFIAVCQAHVGVARRSGEHVGRNESLRRKG